MTVLVGIVCTDGIVLGSDSSAVFGSETLDTIEQPIDKTFVVRPDVLFASSGDLGLAQRFMHVVQRLRSNDEEWSSLDAIPLGTHVAVNVREDFQKTNVQKPGHVLMGYVAKDNKPYLCEIDNTLQPELKLGKLWFASTGSGMIITHPFLGMMRRVFFGDHGRPSVTEGKFFAYWALALAIELNTGGIKGPSQIGVLTKGDEGWSADLLDDEALSEHEGSVRDAEAHLAKFRRILSGDEPSDTDIPDLED